MTTENRPTDDEIEQAIMNPWICSAGITKRLAQELKDRRAKDAGKVGNQMYPYRCDSCDYQLSFGDYIVVGDGAVEDKKRICRACSAKDAKVDDVRYLVSDAGARCKTVNGKITEHSTKLFAGTKPDMPSLWTEITADEYAAAKRPIELPGSCGSCRYCVDPTDKIAGCKDPLNKSKRPVEPVVKGIAWLCCDDSAGLTYNAFQKINEIIDAVNELKGVK